MLSKILEVFQDIVLPWQRDLKEKRDLLREDPFVGFVAVAVLGAVFYFFFRQSPLWIGFLLLYAGIAMFLLGGIAALAAGWFGWRLYRVAAWPITLVALLLYGCTDTYLTVDTTTKEKPIRSRHIEERPIEITTQTDEIKRFTGRPIFRSIDTIDQVAGRTVHRTLFEGPLNSAGQKHGRWVITTLIPRRAAEDVKWYWQDQEVNEEQWENGGDKQYAGNSMKSDNGLNDGG